MLDGVDTSRAARRPSSLRALVEAIASAPAHEPETQALEWKSSFPLETSAEARYKVARQIIGFSNRDPDRATEAFEGCGYLLIGLEPGEVHGVSPSDPADLDNWLSEYLGQDGPQWGADYIEVGDRLVLVFTVDPPRWGDRIHTLRKPYGSASSGRIFIRRAGKTVEADPAEVRMLEARSQRSSQRIAVEVVGRAEEDSLRSYVTDRRDFQTWRGNELSRLESAVSTYQASMREGWSRSQMERETRSPDAYFNEVKRYLDGSRTRWQALVWEGVVQLRLAVLGFSIRNLSDRNFSGVEVALEIPGSVKPFTDASEPGERLQASSPPALYGSRTIAAQIRKQIQGVKPIKAFSPRIELGDAFNRIVFPAQDVRPHQVHPLPELHLAIPQPLVGDEVQIKWRATSTNADGDVAGTLQFPVDGNPHQAPYLVASAEDASGQQ